MERKVSGDPEAQAYRVCRNCSQQTRYKRQAFQNTERHGTQDTEACIHEKDRDRCGDNIGDNAPFKHFRAVLSGKDAVAQEIRTARVVV